ncbi:MsnO8 family LLM class oxidoreductase [Bacillus sp. PS06]|uniref:MsnO8 family LLM class oxidoreductase n=1 Tax=Bacillus sp. PS06 TaxID=2764176 RepID=UPI0017812B29|nr:MsnO8 family LLM class oxidoreductase [Bacillus sp. PS06]MBD8067995.1 MsnO8 family LLM class oxidoreductase [Bacillus sp. PS06]
MKLSILDQAPVLENETAEQALKEAIKLAQMGDALGYHRYWLTEHHNFINLASSSPEVLLAAIGAKTKRIRIGSGATLLPHYKPYKIAETFNTLAALFPNRVDLGLGRAPGGSAEATMALSEQFLLEVYKFPEKVKELKHFIHQTFPQEHQYSSVLPIPIPQQKPEVWILGTSQKSAILAAEMGMAYAFGQFMSDQSGVEILSRYREEWKVRYGNMKISQTNITVNVICAKTTDKAKEMISTLSEDMKENMTQQKTIVGDPHVVQEELEELKEKYQTEEIMINTPARSYEERLLSLQLIADKLL